MTKFYINQKISFPLLSPVTISSCNVNLPNSSDFQKQKYPINNCNIIKNPQERVIFTNSNLEQRHLNTDLPKNEKGFGDETFDEQVDVRNQGETPTIKLPRGNPGNAR